MVAIRDAPRVVEDDCLAAGIPGEVMVVYMPRRKIYDWNGPKVTQLEPGTCWHAYYFDPVTGRTFDQGTIEADDGEEAGGMESLEFQKLVPSPQDWVLVLERK